MRRAAGKLRRVTPQSLTTLGAERLAALLFEVAETRPDLKRRLRMELAADQGPALLAGEIDKRLAALETSRGRVSWRQRPAFLRDLDALRGLIAERLARLDAAAASERLLRFIGTARQAALRYRERDQELSDIFAAAAADLGPLMTAMAQGPAAAALVESFAQNPGGWRAWSPSLLRAVSRTLAAELLAQMAEARTATPAWIALIRGTADAAGDVDAYRATFTAQAQKTPAVAADIARRLLDAGEIAAAGEALEQARAAASGDVDWESAWIDYLEAVGDSDQAQAVRWRAFTQRLSIEQLRSYLAQLADFEDVEVEAQAMQIAAATPQFRDGLRVLMDWPALAEAAAMIESRRKEINVDPAAAELWAGQLRRRYPQAAELLLRGAAALAFRRGDLRSCERLTAEADSLER